VSRISGTNRKRLEEIISRAGDRTANVARDIATVAEILLEQDKAATESPRMKRIVGPSPKQGFGQ
jgi:hypothetical protein